MEINKRAAPCHWLLLRLAGRIPDGLLSQAREWLAQGRLREIAEALTHTAIATRLRLGRDDLDLLIDLHADSGDVPSSLLAVDTTDLEPLPLFVFSNTAPDPEPPTAAPVAQALVAAAPDTGALRAIWRSWRSPMKNAPWPPPRQIFVVEADEDVDLLALTARLQGTLSAAGEVEPQVEVYPTQIEPPVYQQLARNSGDLLWARDPDPGIQLAAVFDEVDAETGPSLRPDHPVVDDEEKDLLLGYLSRGVLLLETTTGMDDVWDRAAGPVVPMNFRTDGYWIWSDATTYYLHQYGLAPNPDFHEHIRSRRHAWTEVDGAAIHRALAVLETPLDEDPAWPLA